MVATTALIIAAALYAGSLHLMEMRADLARSAAQAEQNRALIESLRSQTVTFESSLAANGQLIERMSKRANLVSTRSSVPSRKKLQQKKKRW